MGGVGEELYMPVLQYVLLPLTKGATITLQSGYKPQNTPMTIIVVYL